MQSRDMVVRDEGGCSLAARLKEWSMIAASRSDAAVLLAGALDLRLINSYLAINCALLPDCRKSHVSLSHVCCGFTQNCKSPSESLITFTPPWFTLTALPHSLTASS